MSQVTFPQPCIVVHVEGGNVTNVEVNPPVEHQLFIMDYDEADAMGLDNDSYRAWVIAGRPEMLGYKLA